MRGFEILQRNVNARRETRASRCFARNFLQRTGNREFEVADLDLVADRSLKLKKEALLNDGAQSFAKLLHRIGRCRFHRAVKWKIATERTQMNEPRSVRCRENRHGAETNFTRLRFA